MESEKKIHEVDNLKILNKDVSMKINLGYLSGYENNIKIGHKIPFAHLNWINFILTSSKSSISEEEGQKIFWGEAEDHAATGQRDGFQLL